MLYRLFMLLAITAIVAGCASTKIIGYTDPAFSSVTYNNTIVLVRGFGLERDADIETRICSKFQDQNVSCTKFTALFPPTRQYSEDEIYSNLQSHDIKSAVVISAGGDQSASNVFGYQTYGSATAFGNSAYGNTSSYALRSYSRRSRARIRLLDVHSRQTAWVGDANTEGKGMVNVTDKAFDSSLADKVVSTLLKINRF